MAIRIPDFKRQFLLIGLLVFGAGTAIQWKYQRDVETGLALYREEARARSSRVAEKIELSLELLYQGLRTIARLPAVKSISRHAENFSSEEQVVVQEIYNNLATNVALSEVYIVPAGLDPESIDISTGALQAPAITFDKLIVGKNAESNLNNSEKHSESPELEVPEVEIYEYRLMKNQLEWFATNYSKEELIDQLKYPAISGPEVLTCDNSHFKPSAPNDADRSGLVYSVPYYRPDGNLGGEISGVILTRAIQELLPPDSPFALLHLNAQYQVSSNLDKLPESARSLLELGKPDPQLFYSEIIDLQINDRTKSWRLWTGLPNATFLSSPPLKRLKLFWWAAQCTNILIAVLLLRIAYGNATRRKLMQQANAELELKVKERSAQLEASLDEAKRLTIAAEAASKSKGAFLANMSHEIRTPMNGVIGLVDILMDSKVTTEQAEHLSLIKESGESLLTIINDILDFSKIEADKLTLNAEPFSLTQAIRGPIAIIEVKAKTKSVEVVAFIDDDIPDQLIGDAQRIGQILINLLGNAVKFTPPQGGILLHVGLATKPTTDGVELEFSISDSGIGIAEEALTKLFQPFEQADASTTRNFGGTGLGLSISRRLVELMQGNISIRSRVGAGTCIYFTIRLGRSASKLPLSEKKHNTLGECIKSLHILIAEDNQVNQRITIKLLEKHGHRVVVAENGAIAIERLQEASITSSPFDLVLMDCQMPVMDGYTAANKIRQMIDPRIKTIPIIALTANAMIGDEDQCYQAGMNGFVSKPIERKKLYDEITRCTSKQ